jgi:hypothetical protein
MKQLKPNLNVEAERITKGQTSGEKRLKPGQDKNKRKMDKIRPETSRDR